LELLECYGLDYLPMGKAKGGALANGLELVSRCWKFWRLCRRFRPQVMLGLAGPGMAHAGWAMRIPALVFTDTENASLSNRVTFPFAYRILTPACYESSVPKAKHVAYQGYHELAYTHPERFVPDPSMLATWGLEPGEDFIVMRLISWEAMHDLQDRGFSNPAALVRKLSQHGRVLITSEAPLPRELEKHRIQAAPHQIHHLLAFAKLFIGESATMASESATLGTPAIFVSTSTRGYTNEQGRKYGLVHTFSDPATADPLALAKAVEILRDPDREAKAAAARARLLADTIDVTDFVVRLAEGYDPSKSGVDDAGA
jgi:predicted glycosyltransferase